MKANRHYCNMRFDADEIAYLRECITKTTANDATSASLLSKLSKADDVIVDRQAADENERRLLGHE